MIKNDLDKLSIRACSWVLQTLTDNEKGEKSIDPIFDDNLSIWDQILQTIENRTNLQVEGYVDDLLNHADNVLIMAIKTLSKAKEISQYSRDRYMYEQGVIDLYSAF